MDKKEYNKNLLGRFLIVLMGNIIIGTGIGLQRAANLGFAPFTTFNVGIGDIFGLSYSQIFPIINIGIIFVMLFLNRSVIGIGTVINALILGPTADTVMHWASNSLDSSNMAIRIFLLAIGLAFISLGVSLYSNMKMGVSAYDGIFITISKFKPNIKLPIARMISDISAVIIGFIGGATVGVGTVISMLMIGPLIGVFTKFLSKYIFKIKIPV